MCSNADTFDPEGVVVISLNEHPPEYTIRKILEVDVLPSPFEQIDSIKGYEWKVDNKYYSATIILYAVHEKRALHTKFCDKIRAIIFHVDGKNKSSFEDVLSWMPLLGNITSEVQLLVCDECDCDDVYRKKILSWCVGNEFEFIELNPSDETDDSDDEIVSRAKGYGRVIEALQSHMWSNIVMKRDSKGQNQLENGERDVTSNRTLSSTSHKSDNATKKMSVEDEDLVLEEQWLQKVFEGDDADGESFEALFSKFASLKEKATNLVGEERKRYAEKVAIAFWKAMGGEEDEIAGLDDD